MMSHFCRGLIPGLGSSSGRASELLLERLEGWTPLDRAIDYVSAEARHRPAILTALDVLIAHRIVETDEEVYDNVDDEPWSRWGPIAAAFHRHARNAPYLTNADDKRAYVRQLAAVPAPPNSKTYPAARRVSLPRTGSPLKADFEEVLFIRRTHRFFTPEPVTLQDLATLLQVSFGYQRAADAGAFGTVQLRTSPNAGARHEVECYVLALNVDGLPPAIYHYSSTGHHLERLSEVIGRSELAHLIYGQIMAETAPVVLITTAVTERITYKYQDGRAYRLWMYNVGHVAQVFAMASTALGLGAFQTAAFRDSLLDVCLGLDGNREFATYVLACGHVVNLGMPQDMRLLPMTYTEDEGQA